MGLIHGLRGIPAPNQKQQEDNGYSPLFLNVIKKKGVFLISEGTLDLETMECIRKTGKHFDDWLKMNKLKLVKSEIKDHYKIYY